MGTGKAREKKSAGDSTIRLPFPINQKLEGAYEFSDPNVGQLSNGTTYIQLHETSPPQVVEDSPDSNKECFRRNITRQWNKTLRRSWGSSRRNSIESTASLEVEKECEERKNDSSTKVKRVSRQRDWSDELDEDDIRDGRTNSGLSSGPNTWAENPCDTWHHVAPTTE